MPTRDVFAALRKDNWLHAFAGSGHKMAETIRREIRAAFYPDTAEWKHAVWGHAKQVVDQAVAALA